MNKEILLRAMAECSWAMLPKVLSLITASLMQQAGGEIMPALDDMGNAEQAAAQGPGAVKRTPAQDRKVAAQQGSIAVLPIRGVITNRATIDDYFSGTSVERFTSQFQNALADSDVKSILLDVNSPGGTVGGVPELAALIRAGREQKPVIAVVNDGAFSAGYWLASAATEMVLAPSAAVGSIGVYTMHADVSGLLEKFGVKMSFIQAGKYKTEGNPFEPLSEDARAEIQSHVDDYYDQFVGDVAANRGTSVAKVNADFGQGRTFSAPNAVKLGMADRIGSMQDTLARLGVANYSAAGKRRVALAHRSRELALMQTGETP